MTTPTMTSTSLRERALDLVRIAEAELEANRLRESREQFDRELRYLVAAVAQLTGDSTVVEITIDENKPIAAADGLRFSLREYMRRANDSLHVAVECERRCGKALWVMVESLLDLGYTLGTKHHHTFDCLQQFDDEGDPTTDRWGKPFPPPVEPPPVAAATPIGEGLAPSWADDVLRPTTSSIRHASPMLRFGADNCAHVRRYAWVAGVDTINVYASHDITNSSIDLSPELIVRIANEMLTDEERALIIRNADAPLFEHHEPNTERAS